MLSKEFDRLNVLSEKAINDIVTPTELKEFNQLLTAWSESAEYNSLPGFCVPNSKGSLF